MSGSNAIVMTGIDQVIAELGRIPVELQPNVMRRAAKRAANIVKVRAKSNIIRHAKGTDGGFSKVRFVARNITISNIRNRGSRNRAGVRVHVKGPDVPVKGSKYGYWNIEGYAKLISAGSYKSRNRKGTGHFAGFGNYVVDAYEQNKGVVISTYRRNIIKEVERAERRIFRKAMRRYAA